MDATVIESWKREAKATYEGGSGYQAMVALWAEMNVVVAEELRDEKRANGPQGLIGFAESARMNPVLREEIDAIPAEKWQPYSEDSGAVKECAPVEYYPEETAANRYREP
jgi:hypothetical protein